MLKKYNDVLTKKFFQHNYIYRNNSIQQIANKIGCDTKTVRQYMKIHKIQSRPSSVSKFTFTKNFF